MSEQPSHAPRKAPAAPRMLVADADSRVRAQLQELGRERLLAVVAVSSGCEALARVGGEHFDGAFVDAALVDESGRLVRQLRSVPGHERLPLAFLSEHGGVERRIAAAHAGASLFLPKPVDAYAFGAAVDQMLALGRQERMRVLLVDDDEGFASCVAAVLEPVGVVVHAVPDAMHLVETLDEVRPDLLLLDAMLPRVNGWDAVRIVRTMPEWRDLAIVFLTGRTDLEARILAFDAGADDYVAKPLVAEELLAHIRMRLDRRSLLREMVERDVLTRCLSRRALLDAFTRRLSEARRQEHSLSLALLDIDHFKRVNDEHGHMTGDHALMALGRLLNERFRLEDLRGRWGGDEFLVVFPNVSAKAAAAVLARALDEFRTVPFYDDDDRPFFVTFSAGVASYPADGASVHELVRAADRRLYGAKRSGRGQVFNA